jgi:chromosome partitioning protein
MVMTLVVSNRKGGTGKTTVSVNLAAELAALGMRVLLVDLDSQNHCAVGLGLKATKGIPTVHDLFRNARRPLWSAIHQTAWPNLSLAPADPLFEHGSGLRDEKLLGRALSHETITDAFDLVILDTPPSLDILLINALNAADSVIVPYVPHPLSFEGVKQLMRVLFRVKTSTNPGLRIHGFLPIMLAEHIKEHLAITGEIAHQFGGPRVLAGIRNDIKLAESFGVGQPIRYYAPKSRAAGDFAVLGGTVAQTIGIGHPSMGGAVTAAAAHSWSPVPEAP